VLNPNWQERLTVPVRTLQIVVVAMALGCISFMAIVVFLTVYMIECLPIVLAAAIAMIICVLLHFPTSGRMAAWIESKSHLVDQQRQFRR
jgi:hypothetical protein